MMAITLDQARYLSLATFRLDGRIVETPVWFAAAGDCLYVFSAGDAGKVKRLRNNARLRVAPCDVRGRALGDWQDGRGRVETGKVPADGYAALRAKYGWQMLLLDFFARLGGRYERRALICITLDQAANSPST
ncbi:MAG: PPOX class F420-dependent oxidoreductase [Proteobacteria bacterium]|nr:PPOX class F420-dependent oxidoreductase [Pseudomonadota bacterium]HQR02544.1 PPOX class F420-dependent oxidoreductase [Rhodocyclaceae bacterium]